MKLSEAIGWAAGVAALVISGVGFFSALVSQDHLYVAGFVSVFALTAYALQGRGYEKVDD